jgi:hypothetical protein
MTTTVPVPYRPCVCALQERGPGVSVCPWGDLPPDVSLLVFTYLDVGDLYAASRTCKAWGVHWGHPILWANLYAVHFQSRPAALLACSAPLPRASLSDQASGAPSGSSGSSDSPGGAASGLVEGDARGSPGPGAVGAWAGAGAGAGGAGVGAGTGTGAEAPGAEVGGGAWLGGGSGPTWPPRGAPTPLDTGAPHGDAATWPVPRPAPLAAGRAPVGTRADFSREFARERSWVRGRAQLTTLSGHHGTVTCVSLHGQRVISGGDDGCLILWSLVDSRRRRSIIDTCPGSPPGSPAGEGAAGAAPGAGVGTGAGSSGTVSPAPTVLMQQHHKQTREVAKLRSYYGWVGVPWTTRCCLPPTHTCCCCGGGCDRVTHTHTNTPTPLPVAPPPALAGPVPCSWHPPSPTRLLADPICDRHGGPIWCLDVCGDTLYSGSYDTCIKSWDVENGRCQSTLRGHDGWVSCLTARGDRMVGAGHLARPRGGGPGAEVPGRGG